MGSRPRLHGGRLSTGATEGGMGPRIREDNEGKGNKIPRLRCAAGMTCGLGRMSDGFPPPFSRGQALRGSNGGRGGGMTCGWRKGDGSPHARGQGRGRLSGQGRGRPHPGLPPSRGKGGLRAVREPPLRRGGRRGLAVAAATHGFHPGENVPDLRQQLVGDGRRCGESSGGGCRFDAAL